MILEVAYLTIKEGQKEVFEKDFAAASIYISSIKGYINHSLQRCIEVQNKYLLLVYWETLEDHTIGFRTSDVYQSWKKMLHHYYDHFPVVEHFEEVQL